MDTTEDTRPGLEAFNALIERQLVIAAEQDPNHCSRCGRDLIRWYLGFPRPLCPRCLDAGRRAEPPANCEDGCWHLMSLHGPDGCTAKVYPAHSLTGEPCPCERVPDHKPGKEG